MSARERMDWEAVVVPGVAIVGALGLFAVFCVAVGAEPLGVFASIYKAGFGSWYSWQNSLVRAAPLMLCGLATVMPIRAGVMTVGNEGAFVMGALAAAGAGLAAVGLGPVLCLVAMGVAGAIAGGLWIAIAAGLQHYRGVSAVISSLLLNYIGLAVMLQLVEGPMRDPASLNFPATLPIPVTHQLGKLGESRIHMGLVFGVVACLVAWYCLQRTVWGMKVKVVGGNPQAARLVGIPLGEVVLSAAFVGGACAGLAGMVEVAAIHGRASNAVSAGYGYVGILVAFLARQSPLRVIVVSVILGAVLASGGILQREHDLPDATIAVLEGIIFLAILASEALYGRLNWKSMIGGGHDKSETLGVFGLLIALVGGAVRGSIPYLFVSLGECLTEKSGRVNLGMEGILLMGAMTAFWVADYTGSAWMGGMAAMVVGGLLGLLHALITELPAVNDVAAGIAMIIFGSGLAFFFGKQFVAPMAPQLPVMDLAAGASSSVVKAALRISPLFVLGIAAGVLLHYVLHHTRWGLHIRAVGDAPEAALSMGLPVRRIRVAATTIGAAMAGIGGAHLTLYFPGIWSAGISGGQGLMAVALVIFAQWSPLRCVAASVLFGGAQALGPSLQASGVKGFYHVLNASPYLLTLGVMIATCTRKRTLPGIPGALVRRG